MACCWTAPEAAGCNVQQSHVLSVDTRTTKPRYSVEGEWRTADFLVLAAGARNQIAAGNPRTPAGRTGNDSGLLHPADRRLHHREIPAALRRLHLVISAVRSSFRRNLRKHGRAYQRGAENASERFRREARHLDGRRTSFTVTSCRRPESARFPIARFGKELGAGRRCRRLGRPADGRRPLLRDALRRIAGPVARGRLPGKIPRRGSRRRSRPNWNSPRASCGVSTADRFWARP